LFETTTGTQARSIPKSKWQCKVGFAKEPNKPNIIRAEQEVGNIPFNTEVIPPNVLTQLYEGGYEGDNDHSEHNEDGVESAEEEDKTSIADDSPEEQNVTPSPGVEEYVTRSGRYPDYQKDCNTLLSNQFWKNMITKMKINGVK
jgi:hypothetical protein